MKTFFVKSVLLFITLFSFYVIESLTIQKTFIPFSEHISFIRSSGKELINTEQGRFHTIDSIFVEQNAVRVHTTLHSSAMEVFECESTENTECYVSVNSCLINQNSEIWDSLITKGKKPSNNTEILLNKNLAKRLSIKIGEQLCIKTPISNKIVTVSGFFINPFGISSFDNDSFYYILSNSDENYISKINGTYYTFSNEPGSSFISEPLDLQINAYLKIKTIYALISFILFCIMNIAVLIGFARIFTINQYYKKIYTLGKQDTFIHKHILKDLLIYLCLSLILSGIILHNTVFFILNIISVISGEIIYYLNLQRKIYGINRA